MKKDIHPENKEIKITCSCGNSFVTTSTLSKDLNVDVCSECHPFYTGKQKIIDSSGQVDKFKQRYKSRTSSKASTDDAQTQK